MRTESSCKVKDVIKDSYSIYDVIKNTIYKGPNNKKDNHLQ